VNGALRYTGSVFISGPLTVTGTCTGCGGSPLTVDNIVTTSTDGLVVQNTTAATSGVPVQMSPRIKWRGNAWNTAASQTVDFFAEVLPATAATPTGTWKLGYSLNGGAATYPLTVNSSTGDVTVLSGGGYSTSGVSWLARVGGSNVLNLSLTNVQMLAGQFLFWAGRTSMNSTADSLMNVTNNAGSSGMELNVGVPTLGTCTAGSLTSGSHNFAGEITGNTSGSCILNFGTPNFTNTPICFAMSRTSTTHPRISAASASSITITGGVSGEAIGYHCDGRIGT